MKKIIYPLLFILSIMSVQAQSEIKEKENRISRKHVENMSQPVKSYVPIKSSIPQIWIEDREEGKIKVMYKSHFNTLTEETRKYILSHPKKYEILND